MIYSTKQHLPVVDIVTNNILLLLLVKWLQCWPEQTRVGTTLLLLNSKLELYRVTLKCQERNILIFVPHLMLSRGVFLWKVIFFLEDQILSFASSVNFLYKSSGLVFRGILSVINHFLRIVFLCEVLVIHVKPRPQKANN